VKKVASVLSLAVLAVGCSTGTQTISVGLSAWGVEVKPSIECKNVTWFIEPVVVTNVTCRCGKEFSGEAEPASREPVRCEGQGSVRTRKGTNTNHSSLRRSRLPSRSRKPV